MVTPLEAGEEEEEEVPETAVEEVRSDGCQEVDAGEDVLHEEGAHEVHPEGEDAGAAHLFTLKQR